MFLWGKHNDREIGEEEIQKAHKIAYLLHPNETVAWCVTRDGIDRIRFILNGEAKRGDAVQPFKMKTPAPALAQVGVYYASDHWERNQENFAGRQEPIYTPNANDLVVRYIKFLIAETMHRDSGNVAVGLGSLLFTYLPSQVSSLSPDLFDDDNIRRDKSRLVKKLRARFAYSNIVKDDLQAIRLKPSNKQERSLVMRSLEALAPWLSTHDLTMNRDVNLLEEYFGGELPLLDWERNHILADPECGGFGRLVREYNEQFEEDSDMRLADPDKRLSVPSFNGDVIDKNDRFSPPQLTTTELLAIKDSIKRDNQRRKAFRSGRISVCVDGHEYTHFLAANDKSRLFSIPLTASYIEVFGEDNDGQLLLAFFPLSSLGLDGVELGQRLELQVMVEGKKAIQCVITPEEENNDAEFGFVQIKYQAPKRLSLKSMSAFATSLRPTSVAWQAVRTLVAIIILFLIKLIHNNTTGNDLPLPPDPLASSQSKAPDINLLAPRGASNHIFSRPKSGTEPDSLNFRRLTAMNPLESQEKESVGLGYPELSNDGTGIATFKDPYREAMPIAAQASLIDAKEQMLLKLINDYREQNGSAPLRISVALTRGADWMSADMAERKSFGYTYSQWSDLFKQVARFGYKYPVERSEDNAASYFNPASALNLGIRHSTQQPSLTETAIAVSSSDNLASPVFSGNKLSTKAGFNAIRDPNLPDAMNAATAYSDLKSRMLSQPPMMSRLSAQKNTERLLGRGASVFTDAAWPPLPRTHVSSHKDVALALFHTQRLSEPVNLEVRAEAFNTSNTVNYDNPNTTFTLDIQGVNLPPFFGRSSNLTSPRITQFALRITF